VSSLRSKGGALKESRFGAKATVETATPRSPSRGDVKIPVNPAPIERTVTVVARSAAAIGLVVAALSSGST